MVRGKIVFSYNGSIDDLCLLAGPATSAKQGSFDVDVKIRAINRSYSMPSNDLRPLWMDVPGVPL